jgi:hypothetical protein
MTVPADRTEHDAGSMIRHGLKFEAYPPTAYNTLR